MNIIDRAIFKCGGERLFRKSRLAAEGVCAYIDERVYLIIEQTRQELIQRVAFIADGEEGGRHMLNIEFKVFFSSG
jgi:hypothetical protein